MATTGRDAPAQSATADREIVISRVINAPRELVFEAFTEVRHLSRWWGPDGFTTTTRAFAFRVGGEEFAVLFPGRTMEEALSHLELLRLAIEQSSFLMRSGGERRKRPIESDRRRPSRKKGAPATAPVPEAAQTKELSVTVSIGVAEAMGKKKDVQEVVRAADKALYKAKHNGRNQVVSAVAARSRNRRSIA